MQHKAVGGCLTYPGIKILIMRAHYPELEQNHIQPIRAMIAKMGGDDVATYNGTHRILTFYNGSSIKFGHWSGEESEAEYQGLEFDWIFMDEGTQFSERTFNYLGGCLRGTNDFPKRCYVTCNPGGVGHRWVKRLFIDKQYKTNCKNPEENENPADYTFIFATVDDNQIMLKKSPTYLRTLANMPEDLREAYRYGNWDAIGGNYFKEFTLGIHTCKPFKIPAHWKRYRAFDYGLDKFAIGWFAVDEDGRAWLYKTFEKSNLIISEACKETLSRTFPGEKILATYGPPDMWGRLQETGKTRAEVFFDNGLPIIKADNNRVQGHMIMKECLAEIPLKDESLIEMYKLAGKTPPSKLPALIVFDTEEKVINDIRDIQADENNPDDCAKDPHEVTHNVDMCVDGDTLIATPNGNIPIKELAEEGECYTWDGNKVCVAKHSPSFITRENADVYEIELDNGEKIIATAEHRVLTVAGWKEIKDLTPEDDILSVLDSLNGTPESKI